GKSGLTTIVRVGPGTMPSAMAREVSWRSVALLGILAGETSRRSSAAMDVTTVRRVLPWAGCAAALAATLACDPHCETPEGAGNQDPVSLEVCPALPPGVEPIEGLSVAWAERRFGGL